MYAYLHTFGLVTFSLLYDELSRTEIANSLRGRALGFESSQG